MLKFTHTCSYEASECVHVSCKRDIHTKHDRNTTQLSLPLQACKHCSAVVYATKPHHLYDYIPLYRSVAKQTPNFCASPPNIQPTAIHTPRNTIENWCPSRYAVRRRINTHRLLSEYTKALPPSLSLTSMGGTLRCETVVPMSSHCARHM